MVNASSTVAAIAADAMVAHSFITHSFSSDATNVRHKDSHS